MTQPAGPPDGEARPSWMGAPGYVPPPDLPPHAPMPGAPPYPPYEEHPLPPLGDRGRTGFPVALGAGLVWAAVTLALVLLVAGPPPSARSFGVTVGGVLLPALLAALGTWLVLRRRARAFWVVLLVALPFFLVVRALIAAGAAAS
ncbi:hypothetical protein ACVGOW_22855 [Pseudonocardia saturnea]